MTINIEELCNVIFDDWVLQRKNKRKIGIYKDSVIIGTEFVGNVLKRFYIQTEVLKKAKLDIFSFSNEKDYEELKIKIFNVLDNLIEDESVLLLKGISLSISPSFASYFLYIFGYKNDELLLFDISNSDSNSFVFRNLNELKIKKLQEILR